MTPCRKRNKSPVVPISPPPLLNRRGGADCLELLPTFLTICLTAAYMESVNAIGGIFFKARDPEGLAQWYKRNLGIPAQDGYADFPWREKENPEAIARTVWSLFPHDSDYLGNTPFMINYRVANLETMLEQLRAAGVAIHKVQDHDYGRFAWITDPEGNRIELWEPPQTSSPA
jgi:catechol 2,3-dioxygenase-like lactoylglutathione lyase family enzyme